MPKKMEEKLKREARRKGLSGEAFNRYVYGALAKQKGRLRTRRKRTK